MAKETLHIVTLRRTRYSDRHSIVTAWSRERGRVSLLVNEGGGRGATRARALMIVPSLVECQADIRPGRDIYPATSPSPLAMLASLRNHPLKGMVATVIAELLDCALREGSATPDPAMSDFIDVSLRGLDALDSDTAIANFHLYFIYRMMCMLGIEPDISTHTRNSWLDMAGGIFRPTPPLHPNYLSPPLSELVAAVSRLSLDTIQDLKLTRAERNDTLDALLRYLALHGAIPHTGFKSIDIMRSLLS